MKLLDLSFATPQENLASDEALLDECEEGGEEVLRLWEAARPFVALGYTDAAETEADVAACRACNVPILRRSSGGGTVLQGPGCLSYALVLRIPAEGPLSNLADTNGFVMEQQRAAMQELLKRQVEVQGFTDLAVDGRKFSGNAQRRRKRALLFHGTLLLSFDLSLIETLLQMPSRQPAYRAARAHRDFVANLDVPSDAVKEALKHAWNADEPLKNVPHQRIQTLAAGKYSSDTWNFKF